VDERDRRRWLELLGEAVSLFNLVVHGYVLMDNHYHLIVETREANLSRAMQWLQTSYSMGFNRRRGRVGPLFQGRFKAVVVDPAGWGLELSRYVHLNPVRTARQGLDKRARQADRLGARGRPDPVSPVPVMFIKLISVHSIRHLNRLNPFVGTTPQTVFLCVTSRFS